MKPEEAPRGYEFVELNWQRIRREGSRTCGSLQDFMRAFPLTVAWRKQREIQQGPTDLCFEFRAIQQNGVQVTVHAYYRKLADTVGSV